MPTASRPRCLVAWVSPTEPNNAQGMLAHYKPIFRWHSPYCVCVRSKTDIGRFIWGHFRVEPAQKALTHGEGRWHSAEPSTRFFIKNMLARTPLCPTCTDAYNLKHQKRSFVRLIGLFKKVQLLRVTDSMLTRLLLLLPA